MPFQGGQMNIYQGPTGPSPLEILTKMMMMKQQYEEEEKQRQEQFKAQAERDKLQQEGEMTLAKLKQQMLTDAENAKFQEQLQRAMGAAEELRQAYTDPNAMGPFQPGQEPLTGIGSDIVPLAEYYAQQGQFLPPSILSGGIGAQSRENVAQTRAGATVGAATIRTKEIRKKEEQKARNTELATIRKKAEEIADSSTPTEEDIIEAIEYLATTSLMRSKYQKYLQAIETEVKRFWPDSKKLNPEILQAIVEGREPEQTVAPTPQQTMTPTSKPLDKSTLRGVLFK